MCGLKEDDFPKAPDFAESVPLIETNENNAKESEKIEAKESNDSYADLPDYEIV